MDPNPQAAQRQELAAASAAAEAEANAEAAKIQEARLLGGKKLMWLYHLS